ncbi:MAG: TipAS antibiotic-recognition domain-containing protein [Candidatus Bipolaricaulota bacterium]
MERLRPGLCLGELGLSLDQICALIADSKLSRRALASQRVQLERQAARLAATMALIDRTIHDLQERRDMDPHEMFAVFGDFDPAEHEEEVKARWGRTDAYREYSRRASRYTKADWERIRDMNLAVTERMLDAFDRGVLPTSDEGMEIAERARLVIDQAFYPCSHEMHAALATGYLADPRFRAFYDHHRQGLAMWSSEAIRANAKRNAEPT